MKDGVIKGCSLEMMRMSGQTDAGVFIDIIIISLLVFFLATGVIAVFLYLLVVGFGL